MSETLALKLKAQGDKRFDGRESLLSWWQDTAEQFYPERADFTSVQTMGAPPLSHLTTSYPLIVRRDLANMFSAMLRPRDVEWFHIVVDGDDDGINKTGSNWLEEKTQVMRNSMNDTIAGFSRATKECDNDYAAFGQGVIKIEVNWKDKALLFRNRHLRDVVWAEDFTGRINEVHEKWHPTAHTLLDTFAPNKLHQKIHEAARKNPEKTFECRHIVMAKSIYDRLDLGGTKKKMAPAPFVSIYLDVENCAVIEVAPSSTLKYVIPRWQTVSGSPYAYSPCAIAGMPDASLLQSITLTILEAGEMHVHPPRLAIQDAIGGDINLYAGGITFVDKVYMDSKNKAIETLAQDRHGFPIGLEILDRTRAALHEAFYLDRLTFPESTKEMTAFEFGQRTKEWIRRALPLVEPVEQDYNAVMCETIFTTLFEGGFFGPKEQIPEELKGRNIRFKFESPIHQIEERKHGDIFVQSLGLVKAGAEIDPTALDMFNLRSALRDALKGTGAKEDWVRGEEEVEEIASAKQEQAQGMAQMQNMMGVAQQGADAANKAAGAYKAYNEAQQAQGAV